MNKIQKNIIILSILFNFFIVTFYMIYYNDNRKNNKNYIETNSVKVIKNNDIIKNSENPRGIFNEDINIKENILNGFFINKNTLITAAHGVNNSNSYYKIIDINGGEIYSGKLIFKDIENDFAKIEIENYFKNFKEIKLGKNIKLGENIYSYSFGIKDNLVKKNKGKVLEINGNKIKTNIFFEEGSSGGIIYNEKNEILGIIIEIDIINKNGYFLSIIDLI